jgi:hypothetical protein
MDALKDLLGPANVRVKAQQKAHKKAPAKRWKKKAAK